MKIQILSVAIFFAAFLTSCGTKPSADFTVDSTDVIQYAEVAFTNISTDATSYLWDFGDGATSTEESPMHRFLTTGTFTVKLTATNDNADTEVTMDIVVAAHTSTYTLDETVYTVDADIFWYQSSMGGDAYLRLLTTVSGQDNPDLLKLYPNKGLETLPGTYTWDADKPAGSYDIGYTANYAGMTYDWTAIGKTGSGDLVINELDTDLYEVSGTAILSVGSYDFSTGAFNETSTSNITIDYVGAITPLDAK